MTTTTCPTCARRELDDAELVRSVPIVTLGEVDCPECGATFELVVEDGRCGMKIKAIAPWYGGNRMLAESVGKVMGRRDWIGVPFAGGMAELPHLDCRTGVANDVHRHVINLARVMADAHLGPALYRRLRRLLFHPETLTDAQRTCSQPPLDWDIDAALAFFVSAWMGRNGKAGTKGELSGGLSLRWEAGGGDSVVRWRGAIDGLREWRAVLAKWTFDCRDAFAFLDQCHDKIGHGIYADAPWPDDGDKYAHKFDERTQRRLAIKLRFVNARIVVRFSDHPLIRDLYAPEYGWRWIEQEGRTAANKAKAEVLIVRN